MLHVPAVHDPIHDLIEFRLLVGLPQAELVRLIVEPEWNLLELVLSQVACGTADGEPIRGTGPVQLSAVLAFRATTIVEELLH